MNPPNSILEPSLKKPARRTRSFPHRFLFALALSSSLIGLALGAGILGYHVIAGLDWVDSLLNASMILSGMGPVNPLTTDAAKVFASAYALLSGLVFIGATGILLTPIFHRVLHHFHLEEKELK
jgi:cytochrome c biogenesis protein CcdA